MFQVIVRRWVLSLVLAAASVTTAFAENRVALVIGNSTYLHAGELANPRNDAADMAAALEKLGFRVIKGLDLDKTRMDRAIRDFAGALRDAGMGVFFYAGHGLEVDGKNYLVPIDARLKTAEALHFETVRLDIVQGVMEGATETNVLFVDACRDNPLARNLARALGTRSSAVGRGLAIQEAGAGTLISFSTQPGYVAADGKGRNSPYTAALVKYIPTPGKELPQILVQVRNDVMTATARQQVPWEHSALTGAVVLAPHAPTLKPAKLATAPSGDMGVAKPVDAAAASAKPLPQGTEREEEGGCARDQSVKRVASDLAELKQVYDKNAIGILDYNGLKGRLLKRLSPEILRGADNKQCVYRSLKHLKDIYDRDYISILDYNSLKAMLTERLYRK